MVHYRGLKELAWRPKRGYRPEKQQTPDEEEWAAAIAHDRKALEDFHWYRKALRELTAVYKGELPPYKCSLPPRVHDD